MLQTYFFSHIIGLIGGWWDPIPFSSFVFSIKLQSLSGDLNPHDKSNTECTMMPWAASVDQSGALTESLKGSGPYSITYHWIGNELQSCFGALVAIHSSFSFSNLGCLVGLMSIANSGRN